MGRFDGKTAVVTGGASGVGAASARLLAEEGAHVVVVDIDDRGAAVASEIAGRFVHLDVGDAAAWVALARDLGASGGVHLAHLNAGILAAPDAEPFLETPLDRYAAMVRVNLDGVVLGTRTLGPVMLTSGGGSIVATASLAGLIPYGGDPIYSATKHGVVGFVASVAPQLRRAGVRIHAICPGGIDTPLVTGRQMLQMAAGGRSVLEPREVAEAVADLLALDDAGVVQTITKEQGVRTVDIATSLGARRG